MAELVLQATKREQAKKGLPEGRTAGLIPSVLYGHSVEPQIFWVKYLDFSKLYAKAGESSIISLTPDKGKTANVLIQVVQRDPLSSRFTHIDFYQVRMDEKLETNVPLEFIGEAPAVREAGGILVKTLEEVEISCLPKDLPHSITVDIAILKTFDNQIKVRDLPFPTGVEVLTDAETMVALVEAPRTEAEMAALDEKVEADVTKVEGVVKEVAPSEGAALAAEKPEAKGEKKEKK